MIVAIFLPFLFRSITAATASIDFSMERAFSPFVWNYSLTWGVAPGWYAVAPLALSGISGGVPRHVFKLLPKGTCLMMLAPSNVSCQGDYSATMGIHLRANGATVLQLGHPSRRVPLVGSRNVSGPGLRNSTRMIFLRANGATAYPPGPTAQDRG